MKLLKHSLTILEDINSLSDYAASISRTKPNETLISMADCLRKHGFAVDEADSDIDVERGCVHAVSKKGHSFTFYAPPAGELGKGGVEDGISVIAQGYKTDLDAGCYSDIQTAAKYVARMGNGWFKENDPYAYRWL